jgi:hypothetical protein
MNYAYSQIWLRAFYSYDLCIIAYMIKSVSKLWIMHNYNDEKEHLKVINTEHSKTYDIYMNTVLKEKRIKSLKSAHDYSH